MPRIKPPRQQQAGIEPEAKPNRDLGKIAQEIKTLEKGDIRSAIAKGKLLQEAADQCEHGEYLVWLKENLGWSYRTAMRQRKLFELSENRQIADFEKLNISLSALYLVSDMDDDDPSFEAIIEAAKRGRVTYQTAIAIIDEHKTICCASCAVMVLSKKTTSLGDGIFVCDGCVAEWGEMADAGEEVIEEAIRSVVAEGRAPTRDDIKNYIRARKEAKEADERQDIGESRIREPDPDPIEPKEAPPSAVKAAADRAEAASINSRVRAEVQRLMREMVEPRLREREEDAERVVKARKGVFTQQQYNSILRCLHPDTTPTTEQKTEAFRLLQENKIALLSEKEHPKLGAYRPLPTVEEFMKLYEERAGFRPGRKNSGR